MNDALTKDSLAHGELELKLRYIYLSVFIFIYLFIKYIENERIKK